MRLSRSRQGGGSPAPRGGTGRPGRRGPTNGRRPANPRLLRQRLFVFVVVTLLVALGIAAAQGCQGPARGFGGDGGGAGALREHTAVAPGPQQYGAELGAAG